MKIIKKVNKEHFEKILDGTKKYELRLADFDCKCGDILILKEWDTVNKKNTGREIKKEVRSILKTKELDYWTDEEISKHGFQIISFN